MYQGSFAAATGGNNMQMSTFFPAQILIPHLGTFDFFWLQKNRLDLV
jgi:hypothetical protein